MRSILFAATVALVPFAASAQGYPPAGVVRDPVTGMVEAYPDPLIDPGGAAAANIRNYNDAMSDQESGPPAGALPDVPAADPAPFYAPPAFPSIGGGSSDDDNDNN